MNAGGFTIGDEKGSESPVAVLVDAGSEPGGATAWLRAHPLQTTPVLVCAAGVGAAALTELIEAGAADYVPYPVTPALLVKRLERAVRRPRT
jgi:CheY-like chemotaxis protein